MECRKGHLWLEKLSCLCVNLVEPRVHAGWGNAPGAGSGILL